MFLEIVAEGVKKEKKEKKTVIGEPLTLYSEPFLTETLDNTKTSVC